MDLVFLGTSAGVPTRNRNVSGTALLESTGRGWYLIDCGEATQHQVLRTSLSLQELRGCFITHVHGDHCFGLPGLLASAGMSGRREPLDIVLPAALHDWLRLSLSVSQSCLPFELHLQASETFEEWRNDKVAVTPIALSHRVPCHGYVFTEAAGDLRLDVQRLESEGIARGPLWGELAHGRDVQHAGKTLQANLYLKPGRPGQRFVICGDNDSPERLADVMPGTDVLVHEATFTQSLIDRTQVTYGHSSAGAVARFAESAGVANLVLTHFSARYQSNPALSPSIEDIRVEAAAHFSGELILAKDLRRYHLDRSGRLIAVEG